MIRTLAANRGFWMICVLAVAGAAAAGEQQFPEIQRDRMINSPQIARPP